MRSVCVVFLGRLNPGRKSVLRPETDVLISQCEPAADWWNGCESRLDPLILEGAMGGTGGVGLSSAAEREGTMLDGDGIVTPGGLLVASIYRGRTP